MISKEHAEKMNLVNYVLEYSNVRLCFDPRFASVVVPKQFKSTETMTLEVGLNMPVQIVDLRVDENGFSGTLSFNRRPEWVHVSWESVYAVIDHENKGKMWVVDFDPQKNVSVEQLAAAVAATPTPTPPPQQRPKKKLPPYLRVVK